nr:MAG TPA: hypothetical protein [Caudoviricetes sp.]
MLISWGAGNRTPAAFCAFSFRFTNSPAVPATPARLSGLPVIRQSLCPLVSSVRATLVSETHHSSSRVKMYIIHLVTFHSC